MALCVQLESPLTVPADMTGLTTDWICGQTLADIRQYPIPLGRHRVPLSELCRVSGEPRDGVLHLEGDFSAAHGIGARMTQGIVRVQGNAGRDVGLAMQGGEICIHGDAGDSLGAEMQGGLIRVLGSAGNNVGAARTGSRRGMTGGVILIARNAGESAGAHMRRGMIAIGGAAGQLAGHNMLAGTLVVLGDCGPYCGIGMKRGTLALMGCDSPQLMPTFRFACRAQFPVLRLIHRELQTLPGKLACDTLLQACDLYHGDPLSVGKGEVFLPSQHKSTPV